MLPGFTAGALLDAARPDAIDSAPRWSHRTAARSQAGVVPQQRMMLRAEATPTAACTCPCCITHACAVFGGLFGWDTCLTCC